MGIIQLCWKEVNSIREGGFTLYEIGKVLKIVLNETLSYCTLISLPLQSLKDLV